MKRSIHVSMNLHASLKVHEKRYIRDTLLMHNWNKPATAKALGISSSTLYRKMAELGIERKRKEKHKCPKAKN